MSNIKAFTGVDIPPELKDLFTPLMPYLISMVTNISANGTKSISMKFYFPVNTMQYDIEMLQKYTLDFSIEADYMEPVYSIDDPYTPVIPRRRLGETITCNLKLNEHTRTKKQTRATEGSEESTPDSTENSEGKPSLPA